MIGTLLTFALSLAALHAQARPPGPPDAESHRAQALRPAEAEQEHGHGVQAREGHAAEGHGGGEHEGSVADHIFHHVQDEVWVPINFYLGQHHVDISITKHVVNMWIAAGVLLLVFAFATRKRAVVPKGLYNLLETFVLFVRDEIAVKNIGEHEGHRYVSYLCSAFFFILFMNLIGLVPVPGISTATGNVYTTVVLALFTFVMTQVAGMRAQGALGYWAHMVPAGVPKWLYPIMLPVELLGLFTKPFALTVRLFANMVAGHIVIFFLLALTLLLSVYIAPVSVAFALGIYLLELFVALVQAYVFTMLSALFIGMTQHAH
ncbi:MAG: F0F1 ATP synthase subunit A [Myxococcales bacterium]